MRKAGDVFETYSPETVQLMLDKYGINKSPEEISSVHMFLDENKMGGINDGDENLYIYGSGETIKRAVPGTGNPIKGAPAGTKVLQDGPLKEMEEMRQQMNEYRRLKQNQRYGTGNLA